MSEGASIAQSADLPVDPDGATASKPLGKGRRLHLHPFFLLLVFVGGTLGTAAREALAIALPPVNGIPFTILAINVSGAFLLGLLLETLARRGPDHGRRRMVRLMVGTGFMGGFTTYAALATDSAALIGTGSPGVGIGYALATLLIGAGATWAGIAVSSGRAEREAT